MYAAHHKIFFLQMSSGSHHLSTFEFLRRITKDFSEDKIIGKGGSGVVYKVRFKAYLF